jgi:hypothetical protein
MTALNPHDLVVDYMYLGFTSATAFRPTDAMPLRSWNKIAMVAVNVLSQAVQSPRRTRGSTQA